MSDKSDLTEKFVEQINSLAVESDFDLKALLGLLENEEVLNKFIESLSRKEEKQVGDFEFEALKNVIKDLAIKRATDYKVLISLVNIGLCYFK